MAQADIKDVIEKVGIGGSARNLQVIFNISNSSDSDGSQFCDGTALGGSRSGISGFANNNNNRPLIVNEIQQKR